MAKSKEDEVTKALNDLAQSNLRSVDDDDVLRNLVTEYFCDKSDDNVDSTDSDSEPDDDETLSAAQQEQSDVITDVEPDDDVWSTRQCSVSEAGELLRPAEFMNEDNEVEMDVIRRFKCNCKLSGGQPCYIQFTPEEVFRRRLDMQDMTSGMYCSKQWF